MAPTVAPSLTNMATLTDPVFDPDAVVPLVTSPIFVHPEGVPMAVVYGFAVTVRTDRSVAVVPAGTAGLIAETAAPDAVGVPAVRMETDTEHPFYFWKPPTTECLSGCGTRDGHRGHGVRTSGIECGVTGERNVPIKGA